MIEKASFELRKGEIIGFAGLVGSGRTELMKCIFGLSNIIEGNVKINQKMVTINSPRDAMKLGIGLVPEDRKKEGLYRVRDIRFNSTIQVLDTFIKGVFNDDEKEREITQKYIDMMATKTPNQEQIINNLSGGNQQKVMIGRWLATNPQILILDEPTRGVDIGAKSEIYSIMNQLVQVGVSIIMISSELPEVINMSDRVYVMSHGKVTGCLNHTEVTQERIMALATKE
jgi:ribose transport system ATP-binding protein